MIARRRIGADKQIAGCSAMLVFILIRLPSVSFSYNFLVIPRCVFLCHTFCHEHQNAANFSTIFCAKFKMLHSLSYIYWRRVCVDSHPECDGDDGS